MPFTTTQVPALEAGENESMSMFLPFMSLAPELRIQVYKHALRFEFPLRLKRKIPPIYVTVWPFSDWIPCNTGLLAASKAIFRESFPTFCQQNTFVIDIDFLANFKAYHNRFGFSDDSPWHTKHFVIAVKFSPIVEVSQDFFINAFSGFPDKFPHLTKLRVPRVIFQVRKLKAMVMSLTRQYLPILFNRPGFELVLYGPFGQYPFGVYKFERCGCVIRKKAGSEVDWAKNIEGFSKFLTEISDSRFCLDYHLMAEWRNNPIQRIALCPSGMAEVRLEMHDNAFDLLCCTF